MNSEQRDGREPVPQPGDVSGDSVGIECRDGIDVLLDVLDLERIELDMFRGRNLVTGLGRLYGGQVASQALVAASRTVPEDRPVHSLHSYFLRPGDPAVPVIFTVDRARDGRSFTTRRVIAIQHGQPIYVMTASFQLPAPGPEYAEPMPQVPGPSGIAPMAVPEHLDGSPVEASIAKIAAALDVRYVPDATPRVPVPVDQPVRVDTWFKSIVALPDEPLLHACFLVYASDLGVLEPAFVRHAINQAGSGYKLASLDHAMWFHRPHRADDWLLYTRKAPFTGGSRALGLGQMYNEAGDLVVTVMQEGMFRIIGYGEQAPAGSAA